MSFENIITSFFIISAFVFTKMQSAKVIKPLSVPDGAFNKMDFFSSSEIVTKSINEGRIHFYFYENGTCKPVLSITSSRLKKKIGSYRFNFDAVFVPKGNTRQKFAEDYRQTVIDFVKARLKSAKAKMVTSEDVSINLSESIDSQLVEDSSTAKTELVEVVEKRSEKKCFSMLKLIDHGYKQFPYSDKGDEAPLVFSATFLNGSKELTLWGDDMRRAISTCGAEKGSVVNVTDLGRTPVDNGSGKSKIKKLYDVELVSL